MIKQNDYKTPRDRIDRDFLKKMLEEETETTSVFVKVREAEPVNVTARTEPSCGCGMRGSYTRGNKYPSLAMVYSPYQEFEDLYEIDEALSKGTLFAELDLPFEAYRMPSCRCDTRRGGVR